MKNINCRSGGMRRYLPGNGKKNAKEYSIMKITCGEYIKLEE